MLISRGTAPKQAVKWANSLKNSQTTFNEFWNRKSRILGLWFAHP